MSSRWKTSSLLIALCLLLWPSCVHSVPTRLIPEPPIRYTARGDGQTPEMIKNAGGIPARLDLGTTDFDPFSLERHVEGLHTDTMTGKTSTAWVSTSKKLVAADQFAEINRGYVYLMHATPNFIDVATTLGYVNLVPWEAEVSALGGILWRQIVGWLPPGHKVPLTTTLEALRNDPALVKNPDYDVSFDQYTASLEQPQLAGFGEFDVPWVQYRNLKPSPFKSARECALDFMNKNGAAVGWRGQFPLFDKPEEQDTVVEKETGAGQKLPTLSLPKVVFYGDYLWPAEAKQQGGFLTSADISGTGSGIEHTLLGHVSPEEGPSLFLSTSMNFGTAAALAAARAENATKGHSGVVYAVHATPNMFSLDESLPSWWRNTPEKQEFAAAGGILWSQVLGWVQVPHGYALPAQVPKDKKKLFNHFKKAFEQNMDIFHPNKDYDPNFDQYTASVGQPQLLGVSPNVVTVLKGSPGRLEVNFENSRKKKLVEFMDQHGAAVGWKGAFPLLNPVQKITSEMSREAKDQTGVPLPHDDGFLDKTWSFFRSHPVAMALLPAVVAANLIPGVGEAADAAEVATLSTAAVEASGVLAEEVAAAGVEMTAEEAAGEVTAVEEAAEAAPAKGAPISEQDSTELVEEQLRNLPDPPTEAPGASEGLTEMEKQIADLPRPPTELPGQTDVRVRLPGPAAG